MIISGMQSLTLLDYPGKVACTVFLHGCNFRCPFCHNSALLSGDAETLMTDEAFFAFLEKRRGLLDAVCVSGGEPTLQPGLPGLLARIKAMGFLTKLDTNGSRPQVLQRLIESGLLDYVAMDVKNSAARFCETAGTPVDTACIEASLRLLSGSGLPYELRTTVVSELHSAESIQEMGRWVSGVCAPRRIPALYLQPFADRDSVLQQGLHKPCNEEIQQYLNILRPYAEFVSIRG